MRRRTVSISLLVAVALMLPVAGAQAAGGPALTESGRASFPNRAYVLGLPAGRVAHAEQVHVRENGHPVDGAEVVPASAASVHGFGVVLVIDTSRSMKGRAIGDAMAAARAFAHRRHPRQQLGVVTFNGSATVALPLTQDAKAIARVLAKPPQLGRNTHIFDAVDTAVRMLAAGRVKPASVVVLSDGSDTGSRIRSARLVAEARRSGVRVFAVGLRSGAFDPAALSALAAATHGVYSTANTPADLTAIYDRLGSRLAHEYVITYRSLAGPGAHVHVAVQVDGVPGTAVAGYTTPRLHTEVQPYHISSFWSSTAAQLLVSLMGGLLLVGTIYFAFSRPARRSLRKRVSQFISPQPESAPEQLPGGPLAKSPSLFAGLGRSFERMSWWPKFEEDLDVASIEMQATEAAGATCVVTVVMLALLTMITGSVLIACVAFVIPYFARRYVRFKAQRQRKHFTDQLADNLQVISSALRAGYSLVGAMAVAVDDAPQPTKREFGRVLADEKLGVPLDQGISVVARRMQNRDLEQVMLVASLQRETGGNTAEVLDRVADTVRERAELRRMIQTLTAQGRISRWVVTALPVVLAGAITLINPSYLSPLFSSTLGHVVLVLAVILLFSGSFAIKKIVTIEV